MPVFAGGGKMRDTNVPPPSTDDYEFDIPEEEGSSDPVYTPIGFDTETGWAMNEGISGVGDGLRWDYTPGSAWDYGIDDGSISQTRDFYYDSGLDDLIANFSPESTRGIQAALVNVGLLSPTSVISFGAWDNNSRSAFRELLGMSNRAGIVWQDMLGQLAKNPSPLRSGRGGGGGGGARRAPFQPRVPDRDEVRRSYRSVASRLLGGNFVDDDQANAFADSFIEQVVSAQRQAYDGKKVTDAPSLEAEAVETLEEDRGTEVDANRFAGYARIMEELVLGG
jgi:hypothetical protein